jgi:hypothetical protein
MYAFLRLIWRTTRLFLRCLLKCGLLNFAVISLWLNRILLFRVVVRTMLFCEG